MTIWTVVLAILFLGAVGVLGSFEYRSGRVAGALILIGGAIIVLLIVGYVTSTMAY